MTCDATCRSHERGTARKEARTCLPVRVQLSEEALKLLMCVTDSRFKERLVDFLLPEAHTEAQWWQVPTARCGRYSRQALCFGKGWADACQQYGVLAVLG